MAKIIENTNGRRTIRVSTDDILSLVREYQTITRGVKDYQGLRKILSENSFYLPEDL